MLFKVQAQQSVKQIKAEFEKLHQFLKDKEETRIRALNEEEKQISQMIKTIEEFSKDLLSVRPNKNHWEGD